MEDRHENAVPVVGTGHGAKQASSDCNFPPSTAATQRLKLLRYLERHGSISTLEARSILKVMSVAARIWELRHQLGHRIITHRDHRRVARYILLPGHEAGGTHG